MKSSLLAERLPSEHYDILTRDDAVIAFAFAQVFVDGSVDPTSLRRALIAITRESDPVVLRFRGWADPETRVARLQEMQEFLSAGSGDAVAPPSGPPSLDGILDRVGRLWQRTKK